MVTPSRVALARQRRGFSASALAKTIDVARQTLAAWESGEQQPTPTNLAALATVLEFPVAFFEGSDVEPLPIGAVSFRAVSKMTASTRDTALAAGRIALMINEWMDQRYRLPSSDVPTLGLQAPTQAADVLRQRWGLGHMPIGNLTHLLEAKGIRIFSLPSDCKTVDAYSLCWDGTPVILLTTGKSAERRRFDLAHELGHLVLHSEREGFQGQKAEDEANHFAAAFLMPRSGLLSRPLRNATLDMILKERARWKVAAMALTYRLNDLGFLTDWQYRSLCIELSRRGYRRAEPGGMHHESSLLLAKVFSSLSTRTSSGAITRIAQDLALTPPELSQHLMGLVVLPILGDAPLQHHDRNQQRHPGLRLA